MLKTLKLLLFIAICSFFVFQSSNAFSQEKKGNVTSFRVITDSKDYHLEKTISYQKNPEIRGDGLPTKMYVVQLARFEDLAQIPSSFPKGTFLWVNPDHPQEKFLLTGYFGSLEEAKKAATTWKKRPEFAGAFARSTPFIVMYE